jgi:arsenite methyltransferase
MNDQPKYGIDGVYYVVGLTLGGFALVVLGLAASIMASGGKLVAAILATALGAAALVVGLLGVRYVRKGKFELRDRLLEMVTWTGNERVLDVGTGGGAYGHRCR